MNGRKKLASPPIEEVVCGLFFPSIPELDPIAVGRFSHDIRDEYRQHAVQPPVTDQAGFTFALGAGPLRSWLISENDEWVIQLQHDRFYLNWRQRGGDYPRFSDEGEKKGVMSRALAEFARFEDFCVREFGAKPAVRRVEVAKVDLLVQGKHWQDFTQLASLVPMFETLRPQAANDDADIRLQVADARHGADFVLAFHYGMQSILGRMPSRGLRIETRANRALKNEEDDVRAQLVDLNAMLNDAFFGMFEQNELSRFGGVIG
jgi:uncharacterized protein (TIGR04255 family)